MSERKEINEDTLEMIVGGKVTYTWGNGHGTCGLNGNNKYQFDDLDEFENFVNTHPDLRNGYLLDALLAAGIIY